MKVLTIICGIFAFVTLSAHASGAKGLVRATTCELAGNVTLQGDIVEEKLLTVSGMKSVDGIANPKCAKLMQKTARRLCRKNNRGDNMADTYTVYFGFKAAEIFNTGQNDHPFDAILTQYKMTTIDANLITGPCTDFIKD